MGRRNAGRATLVALAVLAGSADAAEGQRRSAGSFGLGVIGADPVGELGAYFDAGGGIQLLGSLALDPAGRVRLRGDFGFIIYGYEQQHLCWEAPVGCRIEMDLNTTNNIVFGGLGPEVVLATGAVEPYVNASFGFSYFVTSSSLQGESDFEDFASTTNYDDIVLAWRAGGGMRVHLGGTRKPVYLDLGVERHQNGIAHFLTEGDIVDHPDGSITLLPNRAEANMVLFRIGVSVGIPG
jgi:hypothetical protein